MATPTKKDQWTTPAVVAEGILEDEDSDGKVTLYETQYIAPTALSGGSFSFKIPINAKNTYKCNWHEVITGW